MSPTDTNTGDMEADRATTAGRPALDFANTVGWRTSEQPQDRLHDCADLATWGAGVGLVSASDAVRMRGWARADPAAAARLFSRALALREVVYRIFSRVAAGTVVEESDLDGLNGALEYAMGQVRLVRRGSGFGWGWAEVPSPDPIVWMVVRDGAELLASDLLSRVGECAGPGCGWLYLDESRNRSRRWCDMADCGNRAKARRHYRRRRKGSGPVS